MVLDEFVGACQAAVVEDRPMLAVKELVERAVTDRAVLDDLPGDGPGIFTLHRDPTLSIFQIVVPPGYTSLPHDHLMWAVVGICSGREDHDFFRRAGATLEGSGGRSIYDGDVLALGGETIHGVGNPLQHAQTVAIHAYGGDLVSATRSMWVPDPWTEELYDARRVTGTTFS
jgi:predicted metal-dependent enzyme (double-stranded beta helix superfamily)